MHKLSNKESKEAVLNIFWLYGMLRLYSTAQKIVWDSMRSGNMVILLNDKNWTGISDFEYTSIK